MNVSIGDNIAICSYRGEQRHSTAQVVTLNVGKGTITVLENREGRQQYRTFRAEHLEVAPIE